MKDNNIKSGYRLSFLFFARRALCTFPDIVKRNAGHQLMFVQLGDDPEDWKPMVSIGQGTKEIRIKDSSGQYRCVYVARFKDAIFVLHAFKKKTQKTSKRDIELARKRYNQIKEGF